MRCDQHLSTINLSYITLNVAKLYDGSNVKLLDKISESEGSFFLKSKDGPYQHNSHNCRFYCS